MRTHKIDFSNMSKEQTMQVLRDACDELTADEIRSVIESIFTDDELREIAEDWAID